MGVAQYGRLEVSLQMTLGGKPGRVSVKSRTLERQDGKQLLATRQDVTASHLPNPTGTAP